jgi:hypothetical protein
MEETGLVATTGEVLPVRANDPPLVVAAHTVWNRMIENRSLDVKRACEETGVPRWQFYKALQSEVVQAEVARWLDVLRTIEAKLLRDNWFAVLRHQIDIASGKVGDPRVSVQAARFLATIREEVEEQFEGTPEQDVESPRLRAIMDQFGFSFDDEYVTVIEKYKRTLKGTLPEGEVVER